LLFILPFANNSHVIWAFVVYLYSILWHLWVNRLTLKFIVRLTIGIFEL